MSFCPNCECHACQQARANNDPTSRAKADALRVITRAGELGLTESELQKFSRPFRALYAAARQDVLDDLVAQGALMQHKFPPPAGRGKWRVAFVATQVSQ